jgi:hypothetical protein
VKETKEWAVHVDPFLFLVVKNVFLYVFLFVGSLSFISLVAKNVFLFVAGLYFLSLEVGNVFLFVTSLWC